MGRRRSPVEGLAVIERGFWVGRRVMLTGHTGFVGGWTALWLESLGARVTGVALAAEGQPNLHGVLSPWPRMTSVIADLRDPVALRAAVDEAEPEVVLHLAAQALVRRSYRNPVETWATNVMGTLHLCEALREAARLKALVVITSDKTYLNEEKGRAFVEADPLGGHDPYSASKAAQEMVALAWARSYLHRRGVAVATARAGNLLGGGDWAEDRLVPDLWRAVHGGEQVALRYPYATRPWLHVLDAVRGYLRLAAVLASGGPGSVPPALNFGPEPGQALTVADLAGRVLQGLGGADTWKADDTSLMPEKETLSLDASKAREMLDWKPLLDVDEALQWTIDWYQAHDRGGDMRTFTLGQIDGLKART